MSDLTIRTNNVPRDVVSYADLTEAEQRDFDYIDAEEHFYPRLFRYRGSVYDSHEFVRIVPRARQRGFEHGADADSPLLAWDGIQTESFSSAIVLRWARNEWNGEPDPERVVVGLALS